MKKINFAPGIYSVNTAPTEENDVFLAAIHEMIKIAYKEEIRCYVIIGDPKTGNFKISSTSEPQYLYDVVEHLKNYGCDEVTIGTSQDGWIKKQ